jgi:uncharacterized protein (TIGR02453 family)
MPAPSTSESSATACTGFKPAATRFFKNLAENQNAAWFAEHKPEHERLIKAPMGALVQAVTQRLSTTALPLCGDPKRSLFRINRDVRFTADKSLYKTNAGAVLSRDGSKTSSGPVYVQFGADDIFVACGFYLPMPEQRQLMRHGMRTRQQEWLALRQGLSRRGLSLMTEEALVRVPKGFESAPEAVRDDLRLKSWAVRQDIPARVARSEQMVEAVAGLALSCADLLEFGWSALEAA